MKRSPPDATLSSSSSSSQPYFLKLISFRSGAIARPYDWQNASFAWCTSAPRSAIHAFHFSRPVKSIPPVSAHIGCWGSGLSPFETCCCEAQILYLGVWYRWVRVRV